MREEAMQRAKDRFLKEAFDHMVEFGLENTTIRDLCKKTGVSPGKLYYWFSSKEEIYITAIKNGTGEAAGKLFEFAFSNLSNPEKFFKEFLSEAEKYKPQLKLSVQAATSPVYGKHIREGTMSFNGVYERYIEKMAEIVGCEQKELLPVIYILISILVDYVVWEDYDSSKMQLGYVYGIFKSMVNKDR